MAADHRRARRGRPGTLSARAPWPQIRGARPPPGQPGSPPAPWNAITGRASRPLGRGGVLLGPRGEQSPMPSHGEIPGSVRASPSCRSGCPLPVGRLHGEKGLSASWAKGRPVLSGPRRDCVHTLQLRPHGSHRVWTQPRMDFSRTVFGGVFVFCFVLSNLHSVSFLATRKE